MNLSPQSLVPIRACSARRIRVSLARVLWLGLLLLNLALYITLTPSRYDYWFNAAPSDAAALTALGLSLQFNATFHLAAEHIALLVFTGIAAFLFFKARDWLVLLVATFLLLYMGPVATGASSLQGWLLQVLYAVSATLYILLFLFPDGRFVPRWTRIIAAGWIAWQAARLVVVTLDPPSPIAPGASNALLVGLEISFTLVGLYAQIYRYRRVSTPVQKQQTKWVIFGLAILILGFVLATLPRYLVPALTSEGVPRVLMSYYNKLMLLFTRLALPLTLAIAVLRYRLWDIDVIINRTLVYGALTALVVGMYVGFVSVLGGILQSTNNLLVSLCVTGLIAVVFQPLRERLQRSVNRWMYGERDDPYTVLHTLGQRLESTLAPEAVLFAIVETLGQALKLPYVAIEFASEGADSSITYGKAASPSPALTALPLVYQNERVGTLVLTPRAPGEIFSEADTKLLDDFARQTSVAVHAARLTAALQASRERLVTAQEEERRRIRRDLHDGLGPQLAALAMLAETAREYAHTDPSRTNALLHEMATQTQTALHDIRRLVYNLRPPSLDELGLVGALCAYAARFGAGADPDLEVRVQAPEILPPLPAAVEVAAYRIAQEALANVAKHANARHARLQITYDEVLTLVIQDDGAGVPPEYSRGIGLTSMRERAEELGGTFTIGRLETGGTCITAHLPLPQKPADA